MGFYDGECVIDQLCFTMHVDSNTVNRALPMYDQTFQDGIRLNQWRK